MTTAEFKQALREAASAEFRDIPRDDDGIAHSFSPQFEKKMDRLVRKERSAAWRLVNTSAKRAAAVLIVLLTLSTVALSVDSLREPVVRFVEKVLGISTDYTFTGDVTDHIARQYAPAYVPDGFTLVQSGNTDAAIVTLWENSRGDMLKFVQAVTGSALFSIDAEHGTVRTETVGDLEVKLYEGDGVCVALWLDHGYAFELFSTSGVSCEELLAMVRSLAPAGQ